MKNDFADMLKYYRKIRGLSQAELAEKIGVARTTIASYEQRHRQPDFEIEEKLADFFNIDLNTLRGVIVPALDQKDVEFISIYKAMPSDLKERLMSYAQFLTQQRKD